MYGSQRWNQHYCVISDDNLYYAEEYEEEEEEMKKVGKNFYYLHNIAFIFAMLPFFWNETSN